MEVANHHAVAERDSLRFDALADAAGSRTSATPPYLAMLDSCAVELDRLLGHGSPS